MCGDGVRSGTESCDGTDFGSADCTTAGFYQPAGLACSQFCTFDVAQCQGYCGDGVINGPELCDGVAPAGSCSDVGFDVGSLRCGASCGVSLSGCGQFGWVPELTGLTILNAISGTSRNDLWAVGTDTNNASAIAHFDGAAWSLTAGGVPNFLVAVWSAAVGDAWIVGRPTMTAPAILLHLAGGQWSVMTGAPAATYTDVWSAAPNAVFVATSDAGVLSWNGASWQTLGILTGAVSAIRGVSSTDLWAAKADGTLAHWNGVAWQASPLAIAVRKIDVAASDVVWVIGTNLAGGEAAAYWNGSAWTTYVDASLTQPAQRFVSVVAYAPNDVWVSGPRGAVRHFDGYRWTSTVGSVTVVGSLSFNGFVHFGPAETVASSFDGYAYRYTGQVYAKIDTGITQQTRAVWSDRPDDTFVTDGRGSVYHYDGVTWTSQTLDTVAFTGLWGSGPNDVWVTGGGTGNHTYHYNNGTWTNTAVSSGVSLIWGSGPTDVWFFGTAATHYDGTSFTQVALGTVINAAAGSAPDNVWASGFDPVNGGTMIMHWDGTTWSSMHHAAQINDLAVLAPNDVFATTAGRDILHYDGTAWSDTLVSVAQPLQRIDAAAHDDVFAMTKSELLHFDGSRWSLMRPPNDPSVTTPAHDLQDVQVRPGYIDLLYTGPFPPQPLRRLIRTRFWNCRATETNCTDGVDDDCDGRVDSLDSDCP
ncbi:MAG: uncharacterized protein JWO36_4723 [Myxococcales bacterium]|nr:uncharacterized protein [Myxococcales bacterium]